MQSGALHNLSLIKETGNFNFLQLNLESCYMSDLSIYLISLPKDIVRRNSIKERFPIKFNEFQHIEAIYGVDIKAEEFYKKTFNFSVKYKRMMSPAELGCTLSHIKALEVFLKTDNNIALILEDDVIGNDEDINFILKCLSKVDGNSIVFCGCQNGLMNRYKYGYLLDDYFLKIPRFNYGNFSRTAAYAVTRDLAEKIINFHSMKGLFVADFWFEILKDANANLYYIDVLRHPEDLKDSLIEKDRRIYEKKKIEKIFSTDLIPLIAKRIVKEVYFWFNKIKGAKNIGG